MRKYILILTTSVMKGPGSHTQRPRQLKPFSWRSSLAWILICCFFTQDAAARWDIHLRGEIGGNLTFRCPADLSRSIEFFYLQRNHSFVNGFHSSHKIPTPTWTNTKLDSKDRTTVHMFHLKASHSGDYECLIKDGESLNKTVIKVSVTANYSKPAATRVCPDERTCVVLCSAHGGYPAGSITWDVPESHVWRLENRTGVTDTHTQTVNSSSSASFNCSSGELSTVRCRVGDLTSDNITVCKPKDLPGDLLRVVQIALACVGCIVVFLIVVMTPLICCCQKKRRKKGTAGKEEDGLVSENVYLRDKQEETPEDQDGKPACTGGSLSLVECISDFT